MHTREQEVLFLNTLKISLAQTPQEGPFQVRFVVTQQTREQKELNTRTRVGEDATKKKRLLLLSHASNFSGQ